MCSLKSSLSINLSVDLQLGKWSHKTCKKQRQVQNTAPKAPIKTMKRQNYIPFFNVHQKKHGILHLRSEQRKRLGCLAETTSMRLPCKSMDFNKVSAPSAEENSSFETSLDPARMASMKQRIYHEVKIWLVVEPTHLKNMLVKLEIFPNFRGENKTHLKPPPRNL